jgi:hypothetical protein
MVAADPTRGGDKAHGLTITAIERKGDPDPIAIIAANLKSIGTPAAVSLMTAIRPSWRRSAPPAWRLNPPLLGSAVWLSKCAFWSQLRPIPG